MQIFTINYRSLPPTSTQTRAHHRKELDYSTRRLRAEKGHPRRGATSLGSDISSHYSACLGRYQKTSTPCSFSLGSFGQKFDPGFHYLMVGQVGSGWDLDVWWAGCGWALGVAKSISSSTVLWQKEKLHSMLNQGFCPA